MTSQAPQNYEVIPPDGGRKPIKHWTKGVPFEDQAREQLLNVASLPFIYRHIVAMPDVHWCPGGVAVGSVIPTRGAVMPSAVGQDIGCGMTAVRLARVTVGDVPVDIAAIRHQIERSIPTGHYSHKFEKIAHLEDRMADYEIAVDPLIDFVESDHPTLWRSKKKLMGDTMCAQFGTLGDGNHFIELCFDGDGGLWILLHSGSRGIGAAIARYFTRRARDTMDRYFITLPDKDLAFFAEGTQDFDDYMFAMQYAQRYATANRAMMVDTVMEVLHDSLPGIEADLYIDTPHNFAEREHHYGQDVLVTRKGATRARLGEWAIIPGSLGTPSYIVKGMGNPDSFDSCSHGAGRAMSRRQARQTFTVEQLERDLALIECRKDAKVLDEAPGAYKDISAVIEAQTSLIQPEFMLSQILCVKG